jgi:hypothetical protein
LKSEPVERPLDVKIVTTQMIAGLLSRAAASPRKRMNLNLHAELTDPIARFLNAGIAGTYVRPHRHRIGKWELVSVLQGKFDSSHSLTPLEDDPGAALFVTWLETAAPGHCARARAGGA